jgi:hypothetical protein
MTKLLLACAALLSYTHVFACDPVREERQLQQAFQSMKAQAEAARKANAEKALNQADAAMKVMDVYLDLVYFPGMFDMRGDAFELTVPEGAAYQEMAAELEWLRGAPKSKISLKPGKDRTAQFERLKIYFAGSLKKAALALGDSSGDERLAQRLWALAQWGVESQVRDGGKDYVQVLTHAQRNSLFSRPASERDPHE